MGWSLRPRIRPDVIVTINLVRERKRPCADCPAEIETKDQSDLSLIRFRRRLCKSCYSEARMRANGGGVW
jgi:hypothetical protein